MNTLINYFVCSCFALVLVLSACGDSDNTNEAGGKLNITEAPPPATEEKAATKTTTPNSTPTQTKVVDTRVDDYADEPTPKKGKSANSTSTKNDQGRFVSTPTPVTGTYTPSSTTTTTTYYPPTPTTTTKPSGLSNESSSSTLTTTIPTQKTTLPSKPEPVVLSSSEKSSLKKQLEIEFESAQNKRFENFSLKSKFADPMAGGCITGSFLDNYDPSFSLYTYFGRMRQEPYDIVVEDITLNDEGKITQIRIREKAKLSGD